MDDWVGEPVCKSGKTTGVSCGTITCTDCYVEYGGTQLVHARFATYYNWYGDSGGNVFYDHQAIGISNGIFLDANGNWMSSFYSHIYNAAHDLGYPPGVWPYLGT